MLGHLSFGVSNLAQATAFYDASMAALGYVRVFTGPEYVGYGLPGMERDNLLLILQPDRQFQSEGPGTTGALRKFELRWVTYDVSSNKVAKVKGVSTYRVTGRSLLVSPDGRLYAGHVLVLGGVSPLRALIVGTVSSRQGCPLRRGI